MALDPISSSLKAIIMEHFVFSLFETFGNKFRWIFQFACSSSLHTFRMGHLSLLLITPPSFFAGSDDMYDALEIKILILVLNGQLIKMMCCIDYFKRSCTPSGTFFVLSCTHALWWKTFRGLLVDSEILLGAQRFWPLSYSGIVAAHRSSNWAFHDLVCAWSHSPWFVWKHRSQSIWDCSQLFIRYSIITMENRNDRWEFLDRKSLESTKFWVMSGWTLK